MPQEVGSKPIFKSENALSSFQAQRMKKSKFDLICSCVVNKQEKLDTVHFTKGSSFHYSKRLLINSFNTSINCLTFPFNNKRIMRPKKNLECSISAVVNYNVSLMKSLLKKKNLLLKIVKKIRKIKSSK